MLAPVYPFKKRGYERKVNARQHTGSTSARLAAGCLGLGEGVSLIKNCFGEHTYTTHLSKLPDGTLKMQKPS